MQKIAIVDKMHEDGINLLKIILSLNVKLLKIYQKVI
jgi:hypothetical protein